MYFIFQLSSIFMISIKSIYISNFVFYPVLLRNFHKSDVEKKRLVTFAIFELIVIFSTISFNYKYGMINYRVLKQFFFTSQYFIFVFSRQSLFGKYERYYRLGGIALACYIISIFFITGHYRYFGVDYFSGEDFFRMWGAKYIPQWPNGIPLSLVFALWLELKNKDYSLPKCILIVIAAVLTTSRIGLLGTFLVLLYYTIYNFKNWPKRLQKIVLVIGLLLVISGMLFIFLNNSVSRRLFHYGDRLFLLQVSLDAIHKRPLLGFGGNTLDVYNSMFPVKEDMAWLMYHTHNIFLEIGVRYGLLGLFMFCVLLIQCYKNIKTKHCRFMFFMLLGMALFQVYVRDFVFLTYLMYVVNGDVLQEGKG